MNYYLSARNILNIAVFTFSESLCSTVLALLIGIPAAYFVARKKFLGRRFISVFSAVPLCVPALIIALGYITSFGNAGFVNRFLMSLFKLKNPPLSFLYSFWGIVITQGFYEFPIVMKTVADSWAELNSDEADTARLLGAGEFKVFRTVTLFQLLPSIVSACIPVFIFCFFSFMIVLLFGRTGAVTFEVAVYHSAKSSLDFKSAAVLGLCETLCSFAMLFLYAKAEGISGGSKGISFIDDDYRKKLSGLREKILFTLLAFIIIVFFLFPLLSILISSVYLRSGREYVFSFASWLRMFRMKSFASSVKNTFVTGMFTGLFCTATGFAYSVFLRLKDPLNSNALLKTLPLLPMSISSVLTGLILTFIFRWGTAFLLVIAQTALFWPFAFRQIHSHMVKIPDDVISQGKILSCRFSTFVFKIILPYCFTGIVSAFCFCFALSAGDATLPLILSIPKFDTLALFTYRLAGSYHFPEACAAGLLTGIFCMLLFVIAERVQKNNKYNGGL